MEDGRTRVVSAGNGDLGGQLDAEVARDLDDETNDVFQRCVDLLHGSR